MKTAQPAFGKPMLSKGMLSVARAAVDAAPVVFVYKVDGILPPELARYLITRWEAIWRKAGSLKAPALAVLDDRATLTSLTDGALREIGLMRIPDADRDGQTGPSV